MEILLKLHKNLGSVNEEDFSTFGIRFRNTGSNFACQYLKLVRPERELELPELLGHLRAYSQREHRRLRQSGQ